MPAPFEIHQISSSTRLQHATARPANATPVLQQYPQLASVFELDGGDFQPSPSSSAFVDNVHAREFETAFCRDFYCCGLRLVDLHDLLQHYEECHVRFEDENDDDDDDDGDYYYDEDMAESDFVDEEGWSDSDSAPASPSLIELPGSSSLALALALGGGAAGGPGHVAGMAAAAVAAVASASAAASAAHLYPTFQAQYPQPPFGGACPRANQAFSQYNHPILHTTHPLYRHPSDGDGAGYANSSNSNNNYNNNNINTSTAYAMEAFASGINGSTKRKAAEHDRRDGPSAFTDTILRTISSTRGDPGREHWNPLAKRLATQHGASASLLLEKNSAGAGPRLFPGSAQHLSARLGSIGPLSTLHQQGYHRAEQIHSPFVTAAVDLMRQRDEVYSLMEDLSRTGPSSSSSNTGDKPYRCTVLGCDKAYKNPNGLKYHNLHGHCTGSGCDADAADSRPYMCTFLECGKRYKNLNGLKYHIEHSHPNMTAALKAHQSGLMHSGSSSADVFGQYPSQAAMAIAAAVQAVNSSPMMMAAANAILAAQAANSSAATAAAAAENAADCGPATGTGGGVGFGVRRMPMAPTACPGQQQMAVGPRVVLDGGEGIGPPGADLGLVADMQGS